MKQNKILIGLLTLSLSSIAVLGVKNTELKQDLKTTQEQLKVTYDNYKVNKKLADLREGFISNDEWTVMLDEKTNKVYIRNTEDKELQINDFGKYKEVGVK